MGEYVVAFLFKKPSSFDEGFFVLYTLIDTITAIQLLKEEDRKDILNTLNALVRDAKARSAYAPL